MCWKPVILPDLGPPWQGVHSREKRVESVIPPESKVSFRQQIHDWRCLVYTRVCHQIRAKDEPRFCAGPSSKCSLGVTYRHASPSPPPRPSRLRRRISLFPLFFELGFFRVREPFAVCCFFLARARWGWSGRCSSRTIFIRSRMPLPAIEVIIWAIASNCFTRSFTSCGSTPAPAAMRRRRLWSIIFVGLRRSSAVIESMMPNSRFMSCSGSTSPMHLGERAHAGDHAHHLLQRAEPA